MGIRHGISISLEYIRCALNVPSISTQGFMMTKKDAKKLFGKYMTTCSREANLVIDRASYNYIIDKIYANIYKSKDEFRRLFNEEA